MRNFSCETCSVFSQFPVNPLDVTLAVFLSVEKHKLFFQLFYSDIFYLNMSLFVSFTCIRCKIYCTHCQAASLTFGLLLVKPETWRLKLFVFSRWLQIALKESVSKGNED